MNDEARALLQVWFGAGEAPDEATRRSWWAQDPAVDARLRGRFGAVHAEATRGGHDGWASTPLGRVALIVLLDQLSRQLHRGTPGMFAADEKALLLTRDALARGMERSLAPHHRLFLLMPLMHSEDATVQHESVARFHLLARDAAAAGDTGYASNVDFARRHADIVWRFGRYPHRNAILGRVSTAEELAFLEQPGSSF